MRPGPDQSLSHQGELILTFSSAEEEKTAGSCGWHADKLAIILMSPVQFPLCAKPFLYLER